LRGITKDLDAVNLLRGSNQKRKQQSRVQRFICEEPFNSQRADYIKLKISERINHSSATVVYLSSDTANSEWVRWEVEKSIELGKQIIAAHSGDVMSQPLPEFIQKYRVKVAAWSKLGEEIKRTKQDERTGRARRQKRQKRNDV
jgi:hypothetical protein